MKTFLRTLTPLLMICLLAEASIGIAQENPPKPAATETNAKKALEKLKTLAGPWKGEIMRIPITFTIRAVSSGTAIALEGHTEGGGPPNHEITMFYLDAERLLSTHYCDAGNRSNLEGQMSPDGKTIKFSLIDVVGSKRGGYLKDIAFTTIDENHHSAAFTFVTPEGKPIPLLGEFTRTK